jgi:sirohydrochlorin cobaltochelatase
VDSIPVIAAAFGTSTEAQDTYRFFEERFRAAFPGRPLLWAFTSRMLRSRMNERHAGWKSIEEVLTSLEKQGCERAVIQSLHVIPGVEFHKIAAAAGATRIRTAVGRPLMCSHEDCAAVLDALADRIVCGGGRATVLVGHGTCHIAGSVYSRIERIVKERFPEHVYVSVVEGEPSWEAARAQLVCSSAQTVKFIPLMFVAGEHIMSDVLGEPAGDEEPSWRMQLAGYAVDGSEKGLGFNEKICAIYLKHLGEAYNKLSAGPVTPG